MKHCSVARTDRHRGPKAGRGGYTLAELSIVVLILGVLTSAAVPHVTAVLDQHRVMASATRIAADINFARRNAITYGKVRSVSFDVVNDLYQIPGIPDPISPASTSYDVTLSETGYPTDLSSVNFDTQSVLTYNIFGQPLVGGIPMVADGTIVVASGSSSRSVVVDPVTGKAAVP